MLAGTLTGQALRHARNVLLRQRNGDRPDAPDYILVITDGKSFDSISTIARQLHRDGVRVGVTFINAKIGSRIVL